MNKNIKNTIFFIVLLFATLYLIQFGIDSYYKRQAKDKYAQLMNHHLDKDIMFFGPSTVIRHYNPVIIEKVTGLSGYNMGYDGMFFLQYNALIREFLTYSKNCKCIVIGCNMFLGKDWIIMRPDFFYPFLNESNVFNSLKEIEPQKMYLAKYLPGYKLTLLNKSFYWNMIHGQVREDSLKGYSPADTGNKFDYTLKPFKEPIDENVYNTFKETVKMIQDKGIKLVLVMPPIYQDGLKLIENSRDVRDKYKALESKGVYYLDYTDDSLGKNKSYFQTFSHMNSIGSTRYSEIFANDLKKILEAK